MDLKTTDRTPVTSDNAYPRQTSGRIPSKQPTSTDVSRSQPDTDGSRAADSSPALAGLRVRNHVPARQSFVPEIVGTDPGANAVSLNSSMTNAACGRTWSRPGKKGQ